MLFAKGTHLFVQTKEKDPAQFYKFGNSCLATDFTNYKEVNLTGYENVRYSGKNEKFYSSFSFKGGDTCEETAGCPGGSSFQSGFESDEKINYLSLGLFWLRILFLKTVVFNVLMTFKAWMS